MKSAALLLSALALALLPPQFAAAETFAVSDQAEFQAALDAAAGNGEADLIDVAGATIPVASTLTYEPAGAEPHALTIQGVAGATILDGGGVVRILRIVAQAAGADVTVTGILFQGGVVTGPGGGLNVNGDSAQITVGDCEFWACAANGAGSTGGGLSADVETGAILVRDCRFQDNDAAEDGGGATIWARTGGVELRDCDFAGNEAVGDDGGGATAIAEEGGSVTVTGCVFDANTAADDGGGLFTYNSAGNATQTIQNNNFQYNATGLGGGGGFHRCNAPGTISVLDNHYTENSADVWGGGLYVYHAGGDLEVSGNDFDANEALTEGGGGCLIWSGSGNVGVGRNFFQANSAVMNGGGLDVAGDTAVVNVENNVFDANQAGNVGGAINVASDLGVNTFANNTYYGNGAVADGGAVAWYTEQGATALTLANEIVWNCGAVPVANVGLGALQAVYSDVEGGTGEPWFGMGCIDTDPGFADAGGHNFRLEVASPCVDAGTGTLAPAGDFDEVTRGDHPVAPNTGTEPFPDMGAHELLPVPVLLLAFDLEEGPGAVTLRWECATALPAADFRVDVASASGSRVLAVSAEPGARYRAVDADPELAGGGAFTYTLSLREDGQWLALRSATVELAATVPALELLAPHPNPFNPRATIAFRLREAQPVRLSVHDVAGRRMRVLADGIRAAGMHELAWDGRDEGGRPLASGVYLVRLATRGEARTERLVLIR